MGQSLKCVLMVDHLFFVYFFNLLIYLWFWVSLLFLDTKIMDFIEFSSVNTECLQHLLLWQQRHPGPTCLFSLPLLLCLLYQTPDAVSVWVLLMPLNIMVSVSIFLQMAEPYSLLFYFYWVDNIPLCVHDIFSFLFIHSYAPRQTPCHSNSAERHGEHKCADAASVRCHRFLWVCT